MAVHELTVETHTESGATVHTLKSKPRLCRGLRYAPCLTSIYNVYTLVLMDVHYVLHGQAFEWNAAKAAANLRKHGVSFERACEVFFDPFVRLADAGSQSEAREAAIGLTEDWALLFVVHIVRQADAIRIISARPATARERKHYEYE